LEKTKKGSVDKKAQGCCSLVGWLGFLTGFETTKMSPG